MWRVRASPDVQKFLRKLPNHLKERLEKQLKKLKIENPFRFLEHYEGKQLYKYRLGEYRALIDVDFVNKILRVQVLDHRGRIYKRK